MYSKVDKIENKKMMEIIKNNHLKMREEFIKRDKKEKRNETIKGILLFLLFMSVMVFLNIVEGM